jgi:S-adenosylmethionine uptake transporter
MFYYSLTVLPVATAMTLNYTSPLFLALLLASIARERPGRVLLGTVGLGFVGAVLLLRPTVAADQVWAATIGLASGAISAVAYWNVRALVRAGEPEARVVFYFAVFAILGSLLWMAPLTWRPVDLDNVHLLLAIGIFGTAGQLAMTRAYGKGRTLVTAALSYSGIVFSSAFGIAMFGEVLPLLAWIGIVLIVAAGIIAVQLQPNDQRVSPQVASD